jgi:hypothetical protein
MTTYVRGHSEIEPYVTKMLERYHPQLRDAKVTFTYLFAHAAVDKNGDPKGPAVRFGGYAALAVIKIIGLKERADTRADAELTIDGDRWPELSEAGRYALVDHELEHLELKHDKDGNVQRDDLNRPKLVIRKHDHQFGWFDAIVRRHGKDAIEFDQFNRFRTDDFLVKWEPYLNAPDTAPIENLLAQVVAANPIA